MKRKAGISDVALAAGVSTATVDRVIHGREGVSHRSASRVISAIEALGYGKLPAHLKREFVRRYRFGVLLPDNATEFVRDIETRLHAAAEDQNNRAVEIEILRADLLDDIDMSQTLDAIPDGRFDAVAMFALDAPRVKSAMDRLVERGTPTCTIVSDIPNSRRFGFIGQDNVVAGRTAARVMGAHAAQPGNVVIVTGAHTIRDQFARIYGFRELIAKKFPGLDVTEVFEGQSLAARNEAYLTKKLNSDSQITGIYCAAGGASGVIAAVQALKLEKKPTVVVHELTSSTRDALAEGIIEAVIHQDRTLLIEQAIEAMCRKSDGRDWSSSALTTQVFYAENLP